MKIPPNAAAWFGIWTTILLLVSAGTIAIPLGFSPETVAIIKSYAAFFGAINSTILTAAHLWAGPGTGPLAPPPTLAEANAIKNQAVAASVTQGGQK